MKHVRQPNWPNTDFDKTWNMQSRLNRLNTITVKCSCEYQWRHASHWLENKGVDIDQPVSDAYIPKVRLLEGGWNIEKIKTVPDVRLYQEVDQVEDAKHTRPCVWGSGVVRYSAPQQGPGLSPGDQRMLEYIRTVKIKKYIFYSNIAKNFTLELVKSEETLSAIIKKLTIR